MSNIPTGKAIYFQGTTYYLYHATKGGYMVKVLGKEIWAPTQEEARKLAREEIKRQATQESK